MIPEESTIIAHTPLRIRYICYLMTSQGISTTTMCIPHGLFHFADKEFKAQEIKMLNEGNLTGNPVFKPRFWGFKVFLRGQFPTSLARGYLATSGDIFRDFTAL